MVQWVIVEKEKLNIKKLDDISKKNTFKSNSFVMFSFILKVYNE